MDDTLVTSAEPQVVETNNSAVVSQDINVTPQEDGSQVVEQPTPMDDNVTYNNLPQEDTTTNTIVEPSSTMVEPSAEINPNKDIAQNLVQNAIDASRNQNLVNNDGTAMDNFLTNEYDYDHEEAGTYWVAGGINDVDTQMTFLNTLIREEMYDEMDLQKYYYDTTMATARAYAAQKKKETAYGFYRAAQEKAIAEAQLTGWYMPAEGNYMLGQYTVAQNKLEDPDTPMDQRARAERIVNTVEKWFSANQISTRGIKCLSMMNYEENVRHNTIMGELQHEANQIAAQQAAAAGASSYWDDLQFKFDVEELELRWGYDFSKALGLDNKDFLGHDVFNDYSNLEYLSGATNVDNLAKDPRWYAEMLGTRNTQWLKSTLGDSFTKAQENYYKDVQYTAQLDAIENNNGFLKEESLVKSGLTYKGKEVHYTYNENGDVYATYKNNDGQWVQITSPVKAKDSNGKIVNIGGKNSDPRFTKLSSKQLTHNGQVMSIGDKQATDKLAGSYTNNAKDMAKPVREKINKHEAEDGWKVKSGYKAKETFWDNNIKGPASGDYAAQIIMEDEKGQLWAIAPSSGKEYKISKDQIEKKTYYNSIMEIDAKNTMRQLNKDVYYDIDADNNVHVYVRSQTAGNKLLNQTIGIGLGSLAGPAGIAYMEHELAKQGDTFTEIPYEEAVKKYKNLESKIDAVYNYEKGIQSAADKRNINTETTKDEKTTETKPSTKGPGGSSYGSKLVDNQILTYEPHTNYKHTNPELLSYENSPGYLKNEKNIKENNNNVNDVLDQDTGTYYNKKKGGKNNE